MTTRVLVVEDDPKIAAMIGKGLRARSLEVETATSGAGALEGVEAGAVDVLLLDLGLPDMDGLDVLRTLREQGKQLPVIVITARSDPGDRAAALELGVSEYLTKPFAWGQLWSAIDACVPAR